MSKISEVKVNQLYQYPSFSAAGIGGKMTFRHHPLTRSSIKFSVPAILLLLLHLVDTASLNFYEKLTTDLLTNPYKSSPMSTAQLCITYYNHLGPPVSKITKLHRTFLVSLQPRWLTTDPRWICPWYHAKFWVAWIITLLLSLGPNCSLCLGS